MHLSTEQVTAIRQEAVWFFGAKAEVRLSGSHADDQSGFTLVELITIMVIVGILAVAALPRLSGNDAFLERGSADQVAAALRYGQKVAIAQHKIVAVNIASPSTSSDCGANLNAAGNIDCNISSKVAVVATTVRFNALGQPVDAVGTPVAANSSISVGGTTITIQAETGYVH